MPALTHRVATEADIRDYFRLSPRQSKPAVADLVADGELEAVEVQIIQVRQIGRAHV